MAVDRDRHPLAAMMRATLPGLRAAGLVLLLLVSAGLYVHLRSVAPPPDGNPFLFLPAWGLCFLPYLAACGYVLATRPSAGRWQWVEIGIILLGALVFRLIVLPLPADLSRDVWRYLWDARVIVHGFSPYVYAPGAKILVPLRDVLFANCRFRDIPTKYPPGAEGIFVLAYALDPRSLAGIKGLFLGFDLIACAALVWLLRQRGLDARRAILYAWCPLPIVEFALEGHSDVLAITFTVLALCCATGTSTRLRLLTGFLLAAGTLTRFYPILLLPMVVRRRDGPLLAIFGATILLAYLPFLILGHGNAFGVVLAYAGDQGGNSGFVQGAVRLAGKAVGLGGRPLVAVEYAVDLILLLGVSAILLRRRIAGSGSPEVAALALIGTLLAVSSHVFPWYTTALLPWIPFALGPVARARVEAASRILAAVAWYAVCAVFLGYIANVTRLQAAAWWASGFYIDGGIAVKVALAGAIALIVWTASRRLHRGSGSSSPAHSVSLPRHRAG